MSDEWVPREVGRDIVAALAAAIHAHAAELSAIDGAIGDGDHGVNLDKGFATALSRVGQGPLSVSGALRVIGDTLLGDVGGSTGALYGTFFLSMADAGQAAEQIDAATFETMLDNGVSAVLDLGGAHVGDKTLVDVLVPARDAFSASLRSGGTFGHALEQMVQAAERGKESTRDLVARIGRASRLGVRSQGVLDPGATSCALILTVLAANLAPDPEQSALTLVGMDDGAPDA
jgi:phosphoenolpyruvate---glycerone phosphotransferase subunit DhaL